MIDYKYKDEFLEDSADRQVRIELKNESTVITNDDLFNQELTLEESLCSQEELVFGSCEAGIVHFKAANIFSQMKEKEITVKMAPEGEDEFFPIGKYVVKEDKLTSDRAWREITAYDAMYAIINAEVSDWYNSILPEENSSVTMKQFRESFLRHFELEWVIPKGGLANDNMIVERTIEPEQLSGLDVITAICEINGCFGHIGRDGKFHYIYLERAIEGLYPSENLYPGHAPEWMAQAKTGNLYPQEGKGYKITKERQINSSSKDFLVRRIERIQFRMKENDIGKIWPEDGLEGNTYIIEGNFLLYGKSDTELSEIAERLFERITDIVYRPYDCEAAGNPFLEVGDAILIPTEYEVIESYILTRTMKGIQYLTDSYSADGTEEYAEKVNGVQRSIVELEGKTNELVRTVDETRLEMKDMGEGLFNEIKITAAGLDGKITDTKTGLSNDIKITAQGLEGKITAEAERAEGAESKLSNEIKITARGMEAKISKSTSKYDTEGYEISLYGYEDNPDIPYDAAEHNGEYYLNQSDGNLYQSDGSGWVYIKTLSLITEKLSTDIKVTAEGLSSTVAKSITKYDTKGKRVDLYGYGEPGVLYPPEENIGKTYLDQSNGRWYASIGTSWAYAGTLDVLSDNLYSEINQTAEQISLKVSKGEVSSEISLESGEVNISGNRLIISATNFTLSKEGNVSCRNITAYDGTFSGSMKSDNGTHFAKIDNGQFLGGRSGSSATGYVAFNTYLSDTGEFGTSIGGKGLVAIYSPALAVADWKEADESGTVWVGQSGTLKVKRRIESEGGVSVEVWEDLVFKNGLMVTAI